MKAKDMEFIPLLLANDINVYSMARAFHEAYGVKSYVFGKSLRGPCEYSKILVLKNDPEMGKTEVFLKYVKAFASEHADKKIFLIGCGDEYVKLISLNKKQLPSNIIAPYIDAELIEKLINKEDFYKMCDQYGIDYPVTHIFNAGDKTGELKLPFGAPYILKPSNGIAYWQHPYESQKKVYVLDTWEELIATINQIYAAGYDDSLILQEFIPGDDSYMRVMTNYSNRNGKVTMMSLGHVLLEEHTPHGIGNHAVIINEVDEALSQKLRVFLEAIGFVGLSNFDIKFDKRDGKFKVFEINIRQGRSNFYVTAAGFNIAKALVEEYCEGKTANFEILSNKRLWRVVPDSVLYKYISREYHQEMRSLQKAKKCTNPLFYKGDKSLRRFIRMVLAQLNHNRKYKKYCAPIGKV